MMMMMMMVVSMYEDIVYRVMCRQYLYLIRIQLAQVSVRLLGFNCINKPYRFLLHLPFLRLPCAYSSSDSVDRCPPISWYVCLSSNYKLVNKSKSSSEVGVRIERGLVLSSAYCANKSIKVLAGWLLGWFYELAKCPLLRFILYKLS